MSTKLRIETRHITIFVSILLYLCILILGFFSNGNDTLQTWKGFNILLIDKSNNLEMVERELQSIGIKDYISQNNAQVSLGTFGIIGEFSISKIEKVQKDLRYTHYLETVENFFHDESSAFNIIYIEQKEPLPSLMLKLSKALDNKNIIWKVSEWNTRDRSLLLYFIGAFALLAIILSRRFWWASLALIVPWMVLALALGPRMIGASITIFYLSLLVTEAMAKTIRRYVEEGSPNHFFWELFHRPKQAWTSLKAMAPYVKLHSLGKSLILYFITLILFIIVLRLSGDSSSIGILILLMVLIWPIVWIWTAHGYKIRAKKFEHQLFNPIPMAKNRSTHSRYLWPVLIPSLITAIALPFFYEGRSGASANEKIPLPNMDLGSSELSYAKLSLHAQQLENSNLPNLYQVIFHHARQDQLAYIRYEQELKLTNKLPDEGTILTLPRFDGSEETIRFDNSYLNLVKERSSTKNIEKILWSEGQGYGLAYGSSNHVYSADIWSFYGIGMLVGFAIFGLWPRKHKLSKTQFYKS